MNDEFKANMRDPTDMTASFKDSTTFNAEFGGAMVPISTDHSALSNRDKPDQHPIDAISRLRNELEARTDRPITNLEIDAILNM